MTGLGLEQGPTVTLEPFDWDRDGCLVRGWLEGPHVARWFGAIRKNIEVKARLSPESTAQIVVDGHPVGLLCWQRPSWSEIVVAGLGEIDGEVVDIDIFIAEVEALAGGSARRRLSRCSSVSGALPRSGTPESDPRSPVSVRSRRTGRPAFCPGASTPIRSGDRPCTWLQTCALPTRASIDRAAAATNRHEPAGPSWHPDGRWRQ